MLERRDVRLDASYTLFRMRVRGQPRRQRAAAFHAGDALQRAEDRDHVAHVVALAQRVAEAEIVGLALRLAAVAQEEQLEARGGQGAEPFQAWQEDHAKT